MFSYQKFVELLKIFRCHKTPNSRVDTIHNKRINVEYRDDNRTIGNGVLAYISLCCFYSNAKFKYHIKNTAK